MASLSQYIANPTHTHHFKGGFLFEEQIMALNPNFSSVGKSGEIFVEHQLKVEPEPSSIGGICSTKKRVTGAAEEHSLHCKRQRRKACISWETMTSVPDHDGYQWRKYGEKKIMNNHHTRCYYKCTYNKEYKCKATKQVQQQDHSDPPIYNVTYFNTHVCPSSNNMPNIPCTNSSKPQLISSSTNSGQILDFSSNFSQYHFGQEQEQISIIKKESIERSRSLDASTASTVKESLSNTEESMDSSTVKTSGKEFNASELFFDELIDFHKFDSMFYGLEDSEFVDSLFETYDAHYNNNNNNNNQGQMPFLKAEDSSWLLHV